MALILCLSLCACGKSEEAKAVDEMLSAIGEVTNDNLEEAETALAAYNALSDKDRETIENTTILERIQDEMFWVNYYNAVYSLDEVYHAAQFVTDSTKGIWDNVGVDNFWTAYNCIRLLNLDIPKSEYDEIRGKDISTSIWMAAEGLYPEVADTISDAVFHMSDEMAQDIIDICVAFNYEYDLTKDDMTPVGEKTQELIKKYRDAYADEISALEELYLEVSMYADFALEPSGSLASYISQNSDYQNTIERLIKVMKTSYGYN